MKFRSIGRAVINHQKTSSGLRLVAERSLPWGWGQIRRWQRGVWWRVFPWGVASCSVGRRGGLVGRAASALGGGGLELEFLVLILRTWRPGA